MYTQLKLLIVEDNKELVDMYRDIFKDDFDVYVSYDGEEGLIKASNILPDIVVLDIEMPKMNGFEVLKALRENIQPDALVVIVSNRSEDESVKKGMDLGADDYLLKANHDPESVFRHVKKMYHKKQLEA